MHNKMPSALLLSSTVQQLCWTRKRSHRIDISVQKQATTTAEISPPWQMTPYYSKKVGRPMDAQGNIVDSLENTREWSTWNRASQLRIAAETLAVKFEMSLEDLLSRAELLPGLLPGGGLDTLEKLRPGDIFTLARDVDLIPGRLIAYREHLPLQLDINVMLMKWPEMLIYCTDGESVESAFNAIVDYFKGEVGVAGVVEILETTPQLLDDKIFEAVVRGAGHLMPRRQLASSLARYDAYYLQFETLEKEPRNDYEDTLNDSSDYYSKADVELSA